MLIDIVTIFPEFFQVLDISLLGKAQHKGVVRYRVHNLRDFADGRHRTVDDTPYGGGAGMVMMAEPWARALDELVNDDDPLIVFPAPSGESFLQSTAHEWSEEGHLIFGCGRYEGIDQRVFTYAEQKARTRVVSVGDYIVNGGEVASMAMIEAVARLIPGMVGNPASLVSESHEDGLLEYPNYTRPASWRGHDVPSVLLSGNHAAIDKWRHEQQRERTRRVRPDLLEGNAKRTLSGGA